MFGKQDKSDAKTPMIAGSAAMMMKGMGIDPTQVEGVALQLISAVQGVEARLTALETRAVALDAKLDAILAILRGETAPSNGDSA